MVVVCLFTNMLQGVQGPQISDGERKWYLCVCLLVCLLACHRVFWAPAFLRKRENGGCLFVYLLASARTVQGPEISDEEEKMVVF